MPYQTTTNDTSRIKLIIGVGGVFVIVALLFLFVVRFKSIDGNELGVLRGVGGVKKDPVTPGLTWYCPFTSDLYIANIGQQRFVMDDVDGKVDKHSSGRERDTFVVRSVDNQDMSITLGVLWRRDPTRVVDQQSLIGDVSDDTVFVERVLRQPVMTVTKNKLTALKAIEAYSGAEHVAAQNDIEKTLKEFPEFKHYGVIIEQFVFEVKLEDSYTKPIKERQVAVLQQTAYAQQQITAMAKAEVAKADAMADYEKQVVEATRDKQVALLKAEQLQQNVVLAAKAEAEKMVLASKAEAEKMVVAAQAEKDSSLLRAEATRAEGQAKTDIQKLQYSAYSAPGADTFAKIEIAKSLAEAYKGVQGFIPEGMSISTLAENFQKGVGIVVDPTRGRAPIGGQPQQ